jgi:hypothetical protein
MIDRWTARREEARGPGVLQEESLRPERRGFPFFYRRRRSY